MCHSPARDNRIIWRGLRGRDQGIGPIRRDFGDDALVSVRGRTVAHDSASLRDDSPGGGGGRWRSRGAHVKSGCMWHQTAFTTCMAAAAHVVVRLPVVPRPPGRLPRTETGGRGRSDPLISMPVVASRRVGMCTPIQPSAGGRSPSINPCGKANIESFRWSDSGCTPRAVSRLHSRLCALGRAGVVPGCPKLIGGASRGISPRVGSQGPGTHARPADIAM